MSFRRGGTVAPSERMRSIFMALADAAAKTATGTPRREPL